MNSFWRIVFFIFPWAKSAKNHVNRCSTLHDPCNDLALRLGKNLTIFHNLYVRSLFFPSFAQIQIPKKPPQLHAKGFHAIQLLVFFHSRYNLQPIYTSRGGKKKWPKFSNTRAEDSTFSRWLVMTFENWSNHEHLLRRGGGVVSPSLQQGDFPSFSA